MWCYKGVFELIDAKFVGVSGRNVFKFFLHVEKAEKILSLTPDLLIGAAVSGRLAGT